MSDLTFNCPHCEQSLEIPEELLGQIVECPSCNGSIELPRPEPQSDLEPMPEVSPAPAAKAQTKDCPYCGEEILAKTKKCKHCGEFLDSAPHQEQAHAQGPSVQMMGDGKFIFSCSYEDAFAIAERAMTECEVRIKEQSPQRGLIKGKCKYSINPFGITVTATFYAEGQATHLEVAANLTDSFDVFGVCKKKVNQISDRIVAIGESSAALSSGPAHQTTSPAPPSVVRSQAAAPSYAQRAGPSYKGQAVTGFILSLCGLFFGLLALIGLIFSSIALNGMSTSPNKEGKGMAIASLVIGFIGVIGWIMFVLAM